MESHMPLGANLPGAGGIDSVSFQQTMQMQEYKYQEHTKKLDQKWATMKEELEKMTKDSEKLKNHQLPLARVKKIMKSDEDVKMISAEAPALFAKACEMFISELTYRAWFHTEENKRRTLQRSDISQAVAKTEIFDFLLDVVPKEDLPPGMQRPEIAPFPHEQEFLARMPMQPGMYSGQSLFPQMMPSMLPPQSMGQKYPGAEREDESDDSKNQ